LAKPSTAAASSGTPRGAPLGAIAEGAEVKDIDIDRTTLNRIVKWHEGAEPEEWKFWRSLGIPLLHLFNGWCVCPSRESFQHSEDFSPKCMSHMSRNSSPLFVFLAHAVWQSWSRVVGLIPLTHMPIIEKEYFKQLEDHRKKDSGNVSSTFGMFVP
jgi:hypothetical protein